VKEALAEGDKAADKTNMAEEKADKDFDPAEDDAEAAEAEAAGVSSDIDCIQYRKYNSTISYVTDFLQSTF
jgi:hypothetical protein